MKLSTGWTLAKEKAKISKRSNPVVSGTHPDRKEGMAQVTELSEQGSVKEAMLALSAQKRLRILNSRPNMPQDIHTLKMYSSDGVSKDFSAPDYSMIP